MLQLEDDFTDTDLIAKAFRALHTLKGTSSMFGFDNISSILHNIENVYELIRNGEMRLNSDLVSKTLETGDIIKRLLSNQDVYQQDIDNIKLTFARLLQEGKESVGTITEDIPAPDKEQSVVEKKKLNIFSISFIPNRNIFLSGTNPLLLIRDLAELGEISILASHNIPELSNFNTSDCYTQWDITLETESTINAIKDVFIFVEDDCNLEIIEVRDDMTMEDFEEKKDNETEKEEVQESDNFANEKKQTLTSIKEAAASIRVSSEKLDELVNLVGELVIVQARLSQTAIRRNDLELLSLSEEVERLTWNLRDSALNIRMLAIGTTFSKFKRLVRDLSMELKKDVELTTSGEETEIDKTVIEKLNDPLVHIIRNSIDHGVETPDVRASKNKNRTGRIHLSASQSGGYVYIKISDDGGGLDKHKIYQKALEKGLILPDKEYQDHEIYNFVFLPGFSTAASITSVSGRGVGMDVVKRSIEALRGTVEIESELDKGTVVTCKLPLTLAIIEGLLVRVDNEFFVIPLSQVEECVEYNTQKTFDKNGRSLIEIRGSLIPFISLIKEFHLTGNDNNLDQVVIIKDAEYKVGIKVDQIIGEQQVVIKSMGSLFKDVEMVSGATILGDGSVALIIDVMNLINKVESKENKFTHSLFKN